MKARSKKPAVAKEAARGRRRTIGRPSGGSQTVGRDTLLAKTCELLRELPPEKVTRAAVARYTNVDPSLIRYYFQDRASLLVAAAEKLTTDFVRNLDAEVKSSDNSPRSLLRARVHALFDLNVEHPYFHRLLLQEIEPSDSPVAKKLMKELTDRAVGGYEAVLAAGAKEGTLERANPAYLLLAVIGMCEFFAAGLPILKIASSRRLDHKVAANEYREFVGELVLNGLSCGHSGGKSAIRR